MPICPKRNVGIYANSSIDSSLLSTISSSTECSVFQCCIACLNEVSCKYIQYDLTSEGCQTCFLLTIGSGTFDSNNGEVYELEYFSKGNF